MGLNQFLGNNEDLAALVANLIRIGEVTSVNAETATARVRFQDRDDVESFDLQVVGRSALKNKSYAMPDIGEAVLCLFLPSGVETGFIIGSFYPSSVARPAASVDVDVVEYEDGTRIEYDRAAHKLSVSGAEKVEVSGAQEFQVDLGATKIIADGSKLRLESNGSSLELDAAGWRLSGVKGDLN